MVAPFFMEPLFISTVSCIRFRVMGKSMANECLVGFGHRGGPVGKYTLEDAVLDFPMFYSFHLLEPSGLRSYFLLTGAYGPEHWVTSSVSCGGRHQSPIDILDQHARVGEEYQELQLDGFDVESSNKTWMKNTGKTGRLCLLHLYTGQQEMFLVSLVFTLPCLVYVTIENVELSESFEIGPWFENWPLALQAT